MLDTVSRSVSERDNSFRREYVSRSDIAHFVRRNLAWVLTPVAVGLVVAVIYLLLALPAYTARTQLLIDPRMPQPLREGLGDVAVNIDSAQIESQIAVLRSSELAYAVIDKLDLTNNADFQPLDPKFSALPPDQRRIIALGRFDQGLDVRRVGISYAIDVSYAARRPELASAIANAIADAYLQGLIETRARASKVASEWLEERVDRLRKQMNTAARRVQEFKASQDYRIFRRNDQGQQGVGTPAAPAKPTHPGAETESATLDELETTAQTYRKIYESFYQAFAEAVQRESYPISNARVISKANVPMGKSHPKTVLSLALGGLVGALIGFGLAFARHSLERVVRSPQQIRDEIGLDCLGLVPTVGVSASETVFERAKRFAAGLMGRNDGAEKEVALTAFVENPFSPYSEGLKRVKTNIALAGRTRPIRAIGITSASPNEGKTTTAANLAAAFGLSGIKTLLIDGDARSAALSRNLAPNVDAGILQVLAGEATLADTMVAIREGQFDLLPVATGVEHSDQAGQIASEQMNALVQQARDDYTLMIVDLPPIRLVAEALAVCGYLDGIVVVSEWEETPLPILAETTHMLRKAMAPLMGVVITKVNVTSADGADAYAGYRYMDYGAEK